MDTFDCISRHYENYDEDGRLEKRYNSVEFLTTMRYIEKHLAPGMRIIEIGAGTGRYSHSLAGRGYQVDAVELVDHNIELFKSHMTENEPVTITQGNAIDLSAFADESYDITLLLGPMYHLFSREEQLQALSEAVRVTKKDGVVFTAYCMNDATVLMYGFVQGHIHELIEKNMIDTDTFDTTSKPLDIFELYRVEDIDSLRSDFNVSQLHFVASDGYTNHIREAIMQMNDATFSLYLKYHFSVCERRDMVGLSHHTLDIFRKL